MLYTSDCMSIFSLWHRWTGVRIDGKVLEYGAFIDFINKHSQFYEGDLICYYPGKSKKDAKGNGIFDDKESCYVHEALPITIEYAPTKNIIDLYDEHFSWHYEYFVERKQVFEIEKKLNIHIPQEALATFKETVYNDEELYGDVIESECSECAFLLQLVEERNQIIQELKEENMNLKLTTGEMNNEEKEKINIDNIPYTVIKQILILKSKGLSDKEIALKLHDKGRGLSKSQLGALLYTGKTKYPTSQTAQAYGTGLFQDD